MLQLCDTADLNYIHVSAMIHSTAKVWEASDAALASASQQEQYYQVAQVCLSQLLPRLEPMLGVLSAQAASNTLWSFAKLGLDPDAVCSGITIQLLQKVADDKFANAQNKANAVWAMAILQGFTKVSDAAKRIVYRLCSHFMKHVNEPSKRNSATAQNTCCVLHGYVALELKVTPSMLDKLFAYLVKVVQHAPDKVDAQTVSNSLLYCYKLRYLALHASACSGFSSVSPLC